jgi:hypothetical protein
MVVPGVDCPSTSINHAEVTSLELVGIIVVSNICGLFGDIRRGLK